MNYDQDRIFQDFARRTIENLDFFDTARVKYEEATKAKSEKSSAAESEWPAQPWEVTMLVNSFLGLIVLPYEKKIVGDADKEYSELQIPDGDWPQLDLSDWSFSNEDIAKGKTRTLWELLRQIRHSIAHGDIEFHSNHDAANDVLGEITSITFRSMKTGRFRLTMDVKTVTRFCRNLEKSVRAT